MAAAHEEELRAAKEKIEDQPDEFNGALDPEMANGLDERVLVCW